MIMDPWIALCPPTEPVISSSSSSSDIIQEAQEKEDCGSFDDNFNSCDLITSSSQEIKPPPPIIVDFKKLPDSEEYLASLERKLSAVQSGDGPGTKGTKKTEAGKIISSLEEIRESCMVKLLSDPTCPFDPLGTLTFENLKVNPILKKLVPEKQAVSLEELTHLVKADQLQLESTGTENPTEGKAPPVTPNSSEIIDKSEPEQSQDEALTPEIPKPQD